MPTEPVPLDLLHALAVAGLYLAAALAVWLAARRADYRPVAGFLLAVALADLARMAGQRWLILAAWTAQREAGLDPPIVPLSGLGRIGAHVEHAGFLVWSAALAALALAVLARRRPWPVLAAYGVAVAALVLSDPPIRGDALRRVYLACELAALAVTLAATVAWSTRRERPTLPVAAALLIGAHEIVVVIGPYLVDLGASWRMVQAAYLVLYVVLVVIQGRALRGSYRRSRRP